MVELHTAAVASLVNVTVKIFQISYEIKAVDQKARDLLKTTSAITKTLDTAKTLLFQKAHLFSDLERTWITEVAFEEAKRALEKVALLIEDSRVQIESPHGKVRYGTRFMYVMKESPHLMESLTSLTLAGQLLTQAMGIICNRGGEQSPRVIVDGGSATSSSPSLKPPPTYAESEFLNQRRRTYRGDSCNRRTLDEPLRNINSDPRTTSSATTTACAGSELVLEAKGTTYVDAGKGDGSGQSGGLSPIEAAALPRSVQPRSMKSRKHAWFEKQLRESSS